MPILLDLPLSGLSYLGPACLSPLGLSLPCLSKSLFRLSRFCRSGLACPCSCLQSQACLLGLVYCRMSCRACLSLLLVCCQRPLASRRLACPAWACLACPTWLVAVWPVLPSLSRLAFCSPSLGLSLLVFQSLSHLACLIWFVACLLQSLLLPTALCLAYYLSLFTDCLPAACRLSSKHLPLVSLPPATCLPAVSQSSATRWPGTRSALDTGR